MSESIQGLHYEFTKRDDVVGTLVPVPSVIEPNFKYTEEPCLDLVLDLEPHNTEETFTKHKVKLEYGASDEEVDDFAAAHDLEIVLAGANEILIDIDSDSLDTFFERFEILKQIYDFDFYSYWKSRSGNFHAVVKLSSYQPFQSFDDTPVSKMLFAVVLGSDGKRAALGLKDLAIGRKRPSFLFRPRTSDSFTEIL